MLLQSLGTVWCGISVYIISPAAAGLLLRLCSLNETAADRTAGSNRAPAAAFILLPLEKRPLGLRSNGRVQDIIYIFTLQPGASDLGYDGNVSCYSQKQEVRSLRSEGRSEFRASRTERRQNRKWLIFVCRNLEGMGKEGGTSGWWNFLSLH